MVYFVCSACGSSLKKSQVTTHWFKCRKGKHVSCMDCGKDFWGEDYNSHIKCITEDQKYGGSNYVPKENKGERKQEEWVMKIKEKVAESKNMNPRLRELLQNIIQYNNIPRKEAKFRNFMRSSCKVSNPRLVDEVWEIFKEANTKNTNNTNTTNGVNNGVTETDKQGPKTNGEIVPETQAEPEPETNKTNDVVKLNKRERKELRREKQCKKSKKEKQAKHSNDNAEPGSKRKLVSEEEEPNVKTLQPKKKKKKRADDSIVEEEEEEVQVVQTNKSKKKKKQNNELDESIPVNENHLVREEEEEPEESAPRVFKWSSAIKRVLQEGPEEGLKVTKLQRKVFALYFAAHGQDTNVKSKAELVAELHKKLQKKSKFIMYKDKVRIRKV